MLHTYVMTTRVTEEAISAPATGTSTGISATSRPEAPAVELTGLARRYGSSLVLRGVNLEMARGRTVVLRGANGAGKTTLLKVLATRLRPSRGGGRVFGHDLLREAHEVRRRVAFLPAAGGSYPALNARENLRLAATLYGRPDADLDALLARVGLAEVARPVRTFSTGMKKRLGVARLLLSDADLWLLDEPYGALDEAGCGLIDELLVQSRAEGRTVLIASHQQARAELAADAELALEEGVLRTLRLGVARG